MSNAATTPVGYNTLNSYITVKDVPALIDFLRGAFGGVLTQQIRQPDGRIEHAEVKIEDSLLMIGPPEVDALIRTHQDSRPGTFYVFVGDVDSIYQRAMACGAEAWATPADTFYGDRVAAITDKSGNVWWIATRKETLSPEQIQIRAQRHWHRGAATD